MNEMAGHASQDFEAVLLRISATWRPDDNTSLVDAPELQPFLEEDPDRREEVRALQELLHLGRNASIPKEQRR